MSELRELRITAAEILSTNIAPLEKVKKLIHLGYDEADADAMVSRMDVLPNQMAYYEQLPGPEYEK